MPHTPRTIIDRQALLAGLLEKAPASLPLSKARPRVLKICKQALREGQEEIHRQFTSRPGGITNVRKNAHLIDVLIKVLHTYATRHRFVKHKPGRRDGLTIVAVGGYGRGGLSPYSDVDLLFLCEDKEHPYFQKVTEFILYMLWDLGLQPGQASRSVKECIQLAKEDATISTNLLEHRYLAGDRPLYDAFDTAFTTLKRGSEARYIGLKLEEREARHERKGHSRYILEPNLKEGKGGLRDLHLIRWLTHYCFDTADPARLQKLGVFSKEDAQMFRKCTEFMLLVRSHLHYLRGRADERLTFDAQREIASRMNYTDHKGSQGVERFMKRYFLIARDIGHLYRVVVAELEERYALGSQFNLMRWLPLKGYQGRFPLRRGKLDLPEDISLHDQPLLMIRIFAEAYTYDSLIHPRAIARMRKHHKQIDKTLRQDPEANRLFMSILAGKNDPSGVLRMMNEAGVLGRFIPDFGRIVCQMQFDTYHVYTVDEHTINAIGIVSRIEAGDFREELPISTRVIQDISSRAILRLAVFLHDIAKGRGGDHSKIGEQIAYKLGPRLGLSKDDTDTVAWLVRYHLIMSHTAFKRDLNDLKTISDFVARVQTLEKLKLLLVLTVTDIMAVGPNIWNNWKATLLRELYNRAEELMVGGSLVKEREGRVIAAQEALHRELADWEAEAVDAYCAQGYPAFWLSFDVATHARIARMVQEHQRNPVPLTLDVRVDAERDATRVIVCTDTFHGLFARLTGVLSNNGANIVSAKIFTLKHGIAIDTFWIQTRLHEPFERPDLLARLAVHFEHALENTHKPLELSPEAGENLLKPRDKAFRVLPRIIIDNKASESCTLIEVSGKDQLGFLHTVAQVLTDLTLDMISAHIYTYGEKAVDVFYVQEKNGSKIRDHIRQEQVRSALTNALCPDRNA